MGVRLSDTGTIAPSIRSFDQRTSTLVIQNDGFFASRP